MAGGKVWFSDLCFDTLDTKHVTLEIAKSSDAGAMISNAVIVLLVKPLRCRSWLVSVVVL